jgi:hypothetical protein
VRDRALRLLRAIPWQREETTRTAGKPLILGLVAIVELWVWRAPVDAWIGPKLESGLKSAVKKQAGPDRGSPNPGRLMPKDYSRPGW